MRSPQPLFTWRATSTTRYVDSSPAAGGRHCCTRRYRKWRDGGRRARVHGPRQPRGVAAGLAMRRGRRQRRRQEARGAQQLTCGGTRQHAHDDRRRVERLAAAVLRHRERRQQPRNERDERARSGELAHKEPPWAHLRQKGEADVVQARPRLVPVVGELAGDAVEVLHQGGAGQRPRMRAQQRQLLAQLCCGAGLQELRARARAAALPPSQHRRAAVRRAPPRDRRHAAARGCARDAMHPSWRLRYPSSKSHTSTFEQSRSSPLLLRRRNRLRRCPPPVLGAQVQRGRRRGEVLRAVAVLARGGHVVHSELARAHAAPVRA